jgi:hypothetical protein
MFENGEPFFKYKDDPVITKRVAFLNEAHIFYDCDKKKTFRVTNYEYQKCKEVYERELDIMRNSKGFWIPEFILNGCSNWLYKNDEDYSDL